MLWATLPETGQERLRQESKALCVKKGDMVLKKVLPNTKDPGGKWAPKYEGLYVVKHAFSRGALTLTDAEGRDLRHPINADLVKILTKATTEKPTSPQDGGKDKRSNIRRASLIFKPKH
ncbi:hypothetical protein CR513_31755, partial [Mucuna pruriens]